MTTTSRTPVPTSSPETVFSARRLAEILARPGEPARLPTPEQTRIIEYPLRGSVLVIAGAGSGKTETMANRVVWLIANGMIQHDEVLGLTFTRKAAGELAERVSARLATFATHLAEHASLRQLNEAEAERAAVLQEQLADGLALPEISTYNSFASALVQEFGSGAGITSAATVIDTATAWRIAHGIVCASDDPEVAQLDKSIGTIVEYVLELDHTISDNLVDFAQVDAEIDRFARAESWSFADNPRKQPYAPVLKAIAQAESTRVILRLVREFAAEKQRRGVIEFADQLALAVRTLDTVPEARRQLRRRYRAILLDEVQDTSVGQTRLLSSAFGEVPVMGVGDPHQSIYGFRGASASNLASFHQDFSTTGGTGETLTLSVSWRNPTQVLTIANEISAPLAAKLHSESAGTLSVPKLTSREEYLGQTPDTAPEARVDVQFTETVDEEFSALASWVAEARNEHVRKHGVFPTAAVLFRTRRRMAAVQEALTEAGVPSHIVGIGGLLSTPEVTDLLCTLRCLWYADASSELIRLLTGPRFNVGVKDIDGLRRAARWFAARDSEMKPIERAGESPRDRSATRPLWEHERRVTLLDALDEIAAMRSLDRPSLEAVSERGRERLREAGLMLRRLRQSIGGNVQDLLRAVEHELRLDIELDARGSGGGGRAAMARANLDAFADAVESFLLTEPLGSLVSVLEWLERAAEEDQAAEHVPEPEPGTVQLITGHGAKGLEWDLVAIPRMVDGEFPARASEGLGWLRTGQLPDELRGDRQARPRLDWNWLSAQANQKVLKESLEEYRAKLQARHAEEERRLAYVAVTRAASRLLLTGSWWGGTTEPRTPSIYLRELAAAGIIAELPESSTVSEDPRSELGRTLEWPLDPLGSRRAPVIRAAERVRQFRDSESGDRDQSRDSLHYDNIDPVVEILLAEQAAADASEHADESAPLEQITASRFHEFIQAPDVAERDRLRPIPTRPYRRTRIGNLFHEWVERRSTTPQGTAVTLPGLERAIGIDASDLQPLIDQFERSRFANRQPIAVELEVRLPFAGSQLVCKLDAVYADDATGRYEVVDWKSGRPPQNESERDSRFLQLELYRHAYAQWAHIDPELIDVTLFYVAEGRELRGSHQRDLPELERLWHASRDSLRR